MMEKSAMVMRRLTVRMAPERSSSRRERATTSRTVPRRAAISSWVKRRAPARVDSPPGSWLIKPRQAVRDLVEGQFAGGTHQHAQVAAQVVDDFLGKLRLGSDHLAEASGLHHPGAPRLDRLGIDRVALSVKDRHLVEGVPFLAQAQDVLASLRGEAVELDAALLQDVQPGAWVAFEKEHLAAVKPAQADTLRQLLRSSLLQLIEVGIAAQELELIRLAGWNASHRCLDRSCQVLGYWFPRAAARGAGACTSAVLPAAAAFSTSRAHRYRQVW